MTSAFLQEKFLTFLKRRKFDFAIENIFLFSCESDVLGVRDEEIHEFEFKIHPRDFEKDFNKLRHDGSCPNYFYYVISDQSVISGEYHSYAGIYLHSFQKDGFSSFKLIKSPQKIRNTSITRSELYQLLRKEYNSRRENKYRYTE